MARSAGRPLLRISKTGIFNFLVYRLNFMFAGHLGKIPKLVFLKKLGILTSKIMVERSRAA